MIELALEDVLPWLRARLEEAMRPLRKEWKRLRREARKTLDEVRGACERIKEEGEKCVSDRDHRKHKPGRAALRFHKMISGLLSSVELPEELSTDNIAKMQRELAKIYNAIGKEWSGLLAQMEPYMIRARMKLKGSWRRLGDIVRELDGLAARCRPLEIEDEVAAQVSRVEKTLSQLRSVRAELGAIAVERDEVARELSELKAARDSLEKLEVITRLRAAEEAKERLSMEVRTELRHAWKGLVKLRASHEAGLMGLTPEEAEALREYLSDPVAALAREEEGYPRLLALLDRLEAALDRGSVRLKEKKVEKLRKWLGKARSGGLSELQAKCRRAVRELEALRSSEEVRAALEKMGELEERISELEGRLKALSSRARSLEAKRAGLERRLEEELSALSGMLSDVAGEEVRVLVSSA